MKLAKYIFPAILGMSIVTSCDEKLDDINKDPNNSTKANASATLTSGIGYYAVAIDAFYNEVDALFAQYVAGGPGVALIDDERYFVQNADYNNEWGLSYNQALTDLKYTINNGNEAQSAAADILSVHIWQILVDHFGDIPYSEALRGTQDQGGILTPAYDGAESIYDNLVERLDASIALLSSTEDAIGAEDVIYGGDIDKWVRFANSLKLKLLMRQSITNPSKVEADVEALIASGSFIEAEDQIALVPFAGATGLNYNPSYARREAGVGQFYVASQTTVDVLEGLTDPRLEVLYDEAEGPGGIVGMIQGNVDDLISPSRDDFSFPSPVAYAEDNDVILMSNWEVMFLRAEADMRFDTADDELDMYNKAVTAHFSYLDIPGAADYLSEAAAYDPGASDQVKSDQIGVQKWISMNGLQEFEGWIESRRFDTPGSNVFTNVTNGIFYTPTRTTLGQGEYPTIRLYPQTEVSFNPNTPPGRDIQDKVFWDN
jgi:hypothetical protein